MAKKHHKKKPQIQQANPSLLGSDLTFTVNIINQKITALRAEVTRLETLKRHKLMSYRDYLKTSYWFGVRRKALKLAENRCNRCGATVELQVHHRHYRTLGEEDLVDDLEVLCAPCHRAHHGIKETEADKQKTADMKTAIEEKRKHIADKKAARAIKNQAIYLKRLNAKKDIPIIIRKRVF